MNFLYLPICSFAFLQLNSTMNAYVISAAITFICVTLLWLLSLRLRDASIADIFWGSGFAICAWSYFLLIPGETHPRQWLICVLVTIWALRLSAYIFWRNHGKPEDYRYQQWREENGNQWWWRSYLKVFILQGMLLWIIAAPLYAAQSNPSAPALGWVDLGGLLVWLVGFYFEVAGDWQLSKFKANPDNSGKLFTEGVWRYTRHPNYFGDAAQWWGFYLIAVAAGGAWTIFSPLLMTYLLLKVSGVAMLERGMKKSKPGYEDYTLRTNAFFPWFPRG